MRWAEAPIEQRDAAVLQGLIDALALRRVTGRAEREARLAVIGDELPDAGRASHSFELAPAPGDVDVEDGPDCVSVRHAAKGVQVALAVQVRQAGADEENVEAARGRRPEDRSC